MSYRTRILVLAAVLIGAVVGTLVWLAPPQIPPAEAPVAATLPAVRTSKFRNTETGTAFVGALACVACHADAHASYLATAHSQALAEIESEREPDGGEFFDPRSQKRYRIHREGDQIYHEESIHTADGGKLVLADFPVRYVIGSGRFSRSYLIDIDGFLYESPATWYAARPGWALSPGYENHNSGFQRPVELRCLLCHAGRVEPVDNSPQRVDLQALVIDCERCHGPGALHVAKWEREGAARIPGEIDETIVNPAHLERNLREDVCAQCHLHSAATVELPGRRLQDYRPGLLLADFAAHYGVQTPSEEMQVVGHMEQMRLSRCYQESETLTCTTCHHPHDKPSAEEKRTIYRAKCLSCHQEQACTAPASSRFADSIADNCVHCHMPTGDTEIPHFAFTHHRIGIHRPDDHGKTEPEPGELVPLGDDAWLPQPLRERNLGLAYLQYSDAPGQGPIAAAYRQQALSLLERFERDHPGDSEVESSLSRLFWGQDATATIRYAELARQRDHRSPEADATLNFTLGSTLHAEGRFAEAIPWLEQTVKLRPTADVWYMLSDCYSQTGKLDTALDAARHAAQLTPDRPRYVEQIANLLHRTRRDSETASVKARLETLRNYRHLLENRP